MEAGERPIVLATTRFFDEGTELWLRDRGFNVRRSPLAYDQNDADLTQHELQTLLTGVRGWIIGTYPASRELLSGAPDLEIIARRGVGYDTVDTSAANDLGKFVTIAPGGNEASVADHAVALMLAVAKRLREGHERLSAGNWAAIETTELFGKTVGLLGFGRIARQVARRLKGFDVEILAFDPFASAAVAEEYGATFVPFAELITKSDYVSLHMPLTDQTKSMIDASVLAKMKRGAILVNTSRGGQIDEVALLRALQDGHLGGAGLDAFQFEVDPLGQATAGALLQLPNFIGSAHSGGSSREATARTNMIAARCVVDVLERRMPSEECVVVRGQFPVKN